MAKVHASLSPTTNMLLIGLWGFAALVLLATLQMQNALALAGAGGLLGAIGGTFQHLSLRDAMTDFAGASSLMDVRRAMSRTTWGRRYIVWLYTSKFILIVLAATLVEHAVTPIIIAYVGSYMCLMFVRELVTLRDLFALRQFAAGPLDNEQKPA